MNDSALAYVTIGCGALIAISGVLIFSGVPLAQLASLGVGALVAVIGVTRF